MTGRRALMAAVVCAASVAVGAQAAVPAGKRCLSYPATAKVIDASSLPTWVKGFDKPQSYAGGPAEGGINKSFCRDLTGDGRPEMVLSLANGGSSGVFPWLILSRTGSSPVWKVVFWRNELAGLLSVSGREIHNQWTKRRSSDPLCCPTGATVHEVYAYRNGRFRLISSTTS